MASLAEASRSGKITPEETIMLNITGGGEELAKSEGEITYAEPDLVLDPSLPAGTISEQVERLFMN